MGRFKKRVQKKKVVKKVIQQKMQRKQQQKKTAEQQARENEMLKMMLGRPQAPTPGQTQQQDKMQEKLDTMNRNIQAQQNKYAALENQFNTKTQEVENYKQRVEEMQNKLDNIAQEERNVKKEAKTREKERELQERQLDVQDKQEELDAQTKIGELINQTEGAKLEKRQIENEIRRIENEIRGNKVYTEAMNAKAELDFIRADLEAKQAIINSDDYKNAQTKYQEALTEKTKNLITIKELEQKLKQYEEYKRIEGENEQLKYEIAANERALNDNGFVYPAEKIKNIIKAQLVNKNKLRHQEEINNRQDEINRINAEADAQKEYNAELIKRTPKQRTYQRASGIHKKGDLMFDLQGNPIYETDEKGELVYNNDSILDNQRAQLATQIREKRKAVKELDKVQYQTEYYDNIEKELNRERFAAAEKHNELKDALDNINSEPYLNNLKVIEAAKAQNRIQQERNNFIELQIKEGKRRKELQAQMDIKLQYDPTKTDTPEMIEQIKSMNDNVLANYDSQIGQIDNERRRLSLINEVSANIENIKNRYKTIGEKEQADDSIFRLAMNKTGNKLGKDYADYNIANLEKLKGFTKMIYEFDKDALINETSYDSFMQTDDFKNFDWNTAETNQGK